MMHRSYVHIHDLSIEDHMAGRIKKILGYRPK